MATGDYYLEIQAPAWLLDPDLAAEMGGGCCTRIFYVVESDSPNRVAATLCAMFRAECRPSRPFGQCVKEVLGEILTRGQELPFLDGTASDDIEMFGLEWPCFGFGRLDDLAAPKQRIARGGVDSLGGTALGLPPQHLPSQQNPFIAQFTRMARRWEKDYWNGLLCDSTPLPAVSNGDERIAHVGEASRNPAGAMADALRILGARLDTWAGCLPIWTSVDGEQRPSSALRLLFGTGDLRERILLMLEANGQPALGARLEGEMERLQGLASELDEALEKIDLTSSKELAEDGSIVDASGQVGDLWYTAFSDGNYVAELLRTMASVLLETGLQRPVGAIGSNQEIAAKNVTLAGREEAKLQPPQEDVMAMAEDIKHMLSCQARVEEGVDGGDLCAVLDAIADDLLNWGASLKKHMFGIFDLYEKGEITLYQGHFRPFWLSRPIMGMTEAYEMLEYHRGVEYAQVFRERMDILHKAKMEFVNLLVGFTGAANDPSFYEFQAQADDARSDLRRLTSTVVDHIRLLRSQIARAAAANVPTRMMPHAEGTKPNDTNMKPAPVAAVPEPDGIYPPHTVRYKGKACDALSPIQIKIFEYMLKRNSAPKRDVVKHAWETPPRDGAIRTMLYKMSRHLSAADIRLQFYLRGGYIVKV